MKTTTVDIGSRIVMRVYYEGKAHDVAMPMQRHPTEPDQFGGFKMPRDFNRVTRLALRVDGKEIGSVDLAPDLWNLRRGDEMWFVNQMNEASETDK